jgi:formylglycine-generating enzyme required for sulfatase activity
MAFDLQQWKEQVQGRLRDFAANPREAMKRASAETVFGYLVGMTVFPLAQAAATGDPASAFMTLGSIASGVGAQLIANKVQRWHDEASAVQELEKELPVSPELRQALDTVLDKLEVVKAAQEDMSDEDRRWFVERLAEEVQPYQADFTQVNATLRHVSDSLVIVAGRDVIITRERREPSAPAEPTVDRTALEQSYLSHLASDCNLLPLSAIDPKYVDLTGKTRIHLADVYTGLDVTAMVEVARPDLEREEPIWTGVEGIPGLVLEARRLPALEAVSDAKMRCAVLLGDPGSGKTAFVNHLAFCLAMARLQPQEGWLDRLEGWPFGALLPIRVVLRDFAAQALSTDVSQGTAKMVWDFIADRLDKHQLGGYKGHLETHLRREGGMILFDGLDEVPDAARQRERVKEAIADFARSFERCRVLVTCRVYAYQDPLWKLEDFSEYTLAPFNEEQVEGFIERWYRAAAEVERWDEETRQGRARRLKEATREPYLAELASRPLLLTLMATLHTSRGTLPEDRVDLYGDTIKLLLEHWQRTKIRYVDGKEWVEGGLLEELGLTAEPLERALQQVAYEAHERQAQEPERRRDTADIPEHSLLSALKPALGDSYDAASTVVQYVQTRAGLLLERGPKTYAFPHRTIQEYLAACHLSDRGNFATRMAALVRQDPEWWREVFLLAAGKARRGGFAQAVALANTLCPAQYSRERRATETDWRAAALAGQALVEIGLRERAGEDEYYGEALQRMRGWLAGLLSEGALPMLERRDAGDVLGQLDDPRFKGPYLLPEFLEVPAGEFWMGSSPETVERWNKEAGGDYYNDELPQEGVFVDSFLIARYPVTNAQYGLFLEATDREPPPRGRPGRANHPVVYVSWHDAVAYCQWLTQELRHMSEELPTILRERLAEGWVVGLPTEAQWEKAARGDEDRREWPWGDEWDQERCNSGRNRVFDTTPVGIYPAGDSPYGVSGMAGNVLEWCSTLYREYPYEPGDGREDPEAEGPRVVRGGAFGYDLRYVRCACRDRFNPDYRYYGIGFRVVVSSSSPK